jgi:hypothetical protein
MTLAVCAGASDISGLSMNGTDMRCSTYLFICAVQEYAEYAAYRRQ